MTHRHLTAPLLSTLLIFCAGCPTTTPDEPDMSGVKEEMSDLSTADMGEDLAALDMPRDEGSADMQDAPAELMGSCQSVRTSPRTVALDAPTPPPLLWTLDCDHDLSGSALSAQQLGEEMHMLEMTAAVTCSSQGERFTCELTLSDVMIPATASSQEVPLPHELTLRRGDETLATSEIRWHRSASQLEDSLASDPSFSLPDDFQTRGLDVRVKRIAGSPFMFSTMRAEDAKRVTLQVTRLDAPTNDPQSYSLDTAIDLKDLLAQGLQIITHPETQQVEALWWGYDSKRGGFVGLSIGFDAAGEKIHEQVHTLTPSDVGAIQELVDVRGVVGEREDAQNPDLTQSATQLLVLGKMSNGQLAFAEPFTPGNAPLTIFEPNTFPGIEDARVNGHTFGFVSQLGHEEDIVSTENDDYFLLWSSVPTASKEHVTLSFIAANGTPSTSSELLTGFEVTRTYVSQLSPGKLLVLMHGETNRALYHVAIEPVSGEIMSIESAELPQGIDLRPEDRTIELDGHSIMGDSHFIAMGCAQNTRCADGAFKMMGRANSSVFSTSVYSDARPANEPAPPVAIITWDASHTLSAVQPLTQETSSLAAARALTLATINPLENTLHVHHAGLDIAACEQDGCARVVHTTSQGTAVIASAARRGLDICIGNTLERGGWCDAQFAASAPLIELSIRGEDEESVGVVTWMNPDLMQDASSSPTLGLFIKGSDTPVVLRPLTAGDDASQFVAQENPIFVGQADANMNVINGRTLPPAIILGAQHASGKLVLHRLALSGEGEYVEQVATQLELDVITPALPGAPVAVLLTSASDDAREFLPEEMMNKVSAQLTEEQEARPLIVYTRVDGPCGTITVASISTTPAGELTATTVLDIPATQADCSDAIAIAGVADFDGDGAQSASLLGPIIRNRAKIKQRKNYKHTPVEVSPEDIQGAILPPGLPTSTVISFGHADFNGDGFADVYIRTTPYTIEGTEEIAHGVVIFSDGIGGELQTSWPVLTSPDVQWPTGTIQGLAAGRGSGTKKSATHSQSRAELQ